MQNIQDFNSNIPHSLATARRKNKECVSCGRKEKVMHHELNSCSAPECVKKMRLVSRWAAEIAQHVPIAA